jgi:hypothetical protein
MAEGRVFQPAANDLGARDSFIQLRKLPFGNLPEPFGRASGSRTGLPKKSGHRGRQIQNLVAR